MLKLNELKNIEFKELQPKFSSQHSFNNKAMVLTTNDYVALYSYGTLLAVKVIGGNFYTSKDPALYTNTTCKHMREFFKQFTTLDDSLLHKKNFLSCTYGNLDSLDDMD